MATKIRLQRHGKKKSAFYHLVAADEKAKRDGKFIEKLGTYNPNTNPATIDIDFERALYWVKVGAQPTDTAKALLSYKGVLLKNHLDKGIAKGALTEADAQKKFDAWMADKTGKITGKSDTLAKEKLDEAAKKIASEKAISDARATEIAAKNAPIVEEVEEVVVEEAPTTEEAPATEAVTTEEAPVADEAPAAEEVKKEEE